MNTFTLPSQKTSTSLIVGLLVVTGALSFISSLITHPAQNIPASATPQRADVYIQVQTRSNQINVTLGNYGPQAAHGTTLTASTNQTLPPNFNVFRNTPDCTFTSKTMRCQLGTMAAGTRLSKTVMTNLPVGNCSAPKRITIQATIAGSEPDPFQSNNTISVQLCLP